MTLVADHLERRGVRFEALPHERAETAFEEALCLRLDPDAVLRAIVLESRTGPAIAVITAVGQLDLDLVREALADPTVRLATEQEISETFPEFELGAIPALPSLIHVPVVIDPQIMARSKVTIAAGVQRESISLHPVDLLTGGAVTVAPISRSGLRRAPQPLA